MGREILETFLQEKRIHLSAYFPKRGGVRPVVELQRLGAASYAIDQHINETEVATYDALIMPGGALSVDNIRTDRSVLSFVQKFIDQDRVIGTLCHGVWPLLELGFVRSKRLTTVPTIRTDIVNAGGIWEDKPAVVDGNLVSSRTSEDLPAFHDALQRVLESRLQDAT